METKPHINNWLYDNAELVKKILDEATEVKNSNLQIYPLFVEEINNDFTNFCRAKIALEVSKAIGCSTEDVAIALEEIGMERFR